MNSKTIKIVSAVLSAVLVLAVICAGAYLSREKKTFDRQKYNLSLTQIYSRYNTPEAFYNYEGGDSFALSRLLVYGSGGRSYGAKIVAYDEENDFSVLQYETSRDAQKAYYKIQSDGLIAEPDGTAKLAASDVGTIYPEGSNAVGTPQYISKIGMNKSLVKVAVIDTGMMYDHEELQGRIYNSGYDLSGDGCSNAYYDKNKAGTSYGHSTFVAGIIANNTPDTVKIVPYKVVPFGSDSATASSIISAINDAVSNDVSVINISLTSSSSGNSFRTAIRNAKSKGVCVVAAAGNQGREIKSIYPASIEETITVSALSNDFTSFASFSNYGSLVDFCATGRKVKSLDVYSSPTDSKYRTNNGTSFSAPYVASLCADIKTVNKDISYDDLYSVLKDFSLDLGDEGKDDYFGWGMPVISDITYTDNESYTYKIPEGTLSVYGTKDYSADTQPWRAFAAELVRVSIDDSVDRIGNYNFFNVKSATFTRRESYDKIGIYAFYGCENVKEFTFTENCSEVGKGAFGGIDNMVIYGYRNTPAETYALGEGITFNSLGCKHNYFIDIFDPTSTEEGYTLYTCTVCGESYRGAYIQPELIAEGKCGDDMTYSYYDTGKLELSGTGKMYDYSDTPSPWQEYSSDINRIQIDSGVACISAFAFYGCDAINRIICDDSNENLRAVSNVLYSRDMSKLILLPKVRGAIYNLPDSVSDFDASALLLSGGQGIAFNDNFVIEGDIVRDKHGNIICALPSYSENSLSIDSDISVKDYAFILTSCPQKLLASSRGISYGAYSVGYTFDGTMIKNALSVETYDSGSSREYAEQNGFDCKTYNKGECGENAEWYYDTESASLTISGEGALYDCADISEVPWSSYITTVKAVVIGDGITELPDYAFYNAKSLRTLTLPFSISAPENATVWYNCNGIRTINFTLGSGYSDDYKKDGVLLYKFTPWYLSRNTTTSLSIDKNIISVGSSMFRGLSSLVSLTLDKCEEIKEDAFINCTKLNTFTLNSKLCKIADYALFGYKISETSDYRMYTSPVMYCYDDSSARDYCDTFGCKRESLGCGHSRNIEIISSEIHTCCYDSVYEYHCYDCGGDYIDHIPTSNGHYVSAVLKTCGGVPISNADVYIDGEYVAVTNSRGGFVAEEIKCGEHIAEFRYDSVVFAEATVSVDKSDVFENITVAFGDFNRDGIVNGRDLAYVKTQGVDRDIVFDWGENAEDLSLSEKSEPLITPFTTGHTFSPDESSDYRQRFSVTVVNESEYSLVSSGFIFGISMEEDDLVLEKANTVNDDGNTVRIAETTDFSSPAKQLIYGRKSKEGWFSVRYYITYTNGVKMHTYYSDVYKYVY